VQYFFSCLFGMGLERRLQQPVWPHSSMWVKGKWFTEEFQASRIAIFGTQIAGWEGKQKRIAHPNYRAVNNHLRTA
jgi:hypothetical protein